MGLIEIFRGIIYINMVMAEFYESFVLSQKGQLENPERENTRYSKASMIFKNIKTEIDEARKVLRNKKVLMFRKSSFVPNPLVFQPGEFEEGIAPVKNPCLEFVKGKMWDGFLKKAFSLVALANIILILYETIFFPAETRLFNKIDTIFSFAIIIELIMEVSLNGPKNYWKKPGYQRLDFFITPLILINLGVEVWEGSVFGQGGRLRPLIDSLKIMRIFKIMRKSKVSFLKTVSKLIREIMRTLFSLWDFIVIIVVTMVVCSFVGLEILKYNKIQFLEYFCGF